MLLSYRVFPASSPSFDLAASGLGTATNSRSVGALVGAASTTSELLTRHQGKTPSEAEEWRRGTDMNCCPVAWHRGLS